LRRIGELAGALAHEAADAIETKTPFRLASERPFVREFALRGPKSAEEVLGELRHRGIWAGPVAEEDPDVFNVAFTERRSSADVDALVEALREVGKS
jgi:glycine cleavage system pyridoxal-binding protein P